MPLPTNGDQNSRDGDSKWMFHVVSLDVQPRQWIRLNSLENSNGCLQLNQQFLMVIVDRILKWQLWMTKSKQGRGLTSVKLSQIKETNFL